MVACDSDGRIVDLNVRCLQMFGYQREELIGAEVEKLVPIAVPSLAQGATVTDIHGAQASTMDRGT